MTPVRVYADFNDGCATDERVFWNLWLNDERLRTKSNLTKFGIRVGDKVILYQDPDDFEVIATLEWRYIDVLQKDVVVAVVDFSTLRRFPDTY